MNIKKTLGSFNNHVGKLVVGLLIVLVLLIVDILITDSKFVLGAKIEQPPIPTINITSTPTPVSPTPTSIPRQKYIAPTIDPDPPVHCKVSPKCGGGTTPLKQSECSNSICCQIGNNWIFYKDKNQCTKDQNQRNYNYTAPVYVPLPTYAPLPTYSYQPYATPTLSDAQAQAIIDQHNSQVQQCRSNVSSQYSSLIQSCNQYGSSSAADACRSVYEGQRQSAYNACGTIY